MLFTRFIKHTAQQQTAVTATAILVPNRYVVDVQFTCCFPSDDVTGNVLLLGEGTLGLIDFGAAGRLHAFERASVFQLLLALRLGEPSLLYESLVAIGSIPPTRDPDEIERTLARFMAAHLDSALPSADGAPTEV